MMVALKKELLLFDSVQDQIDREKIMDTTSRQYKELKGRHTSILNKIEYYDVPTECER